ncbi:hypothetical protein ACFL6I_27620 [candidate division KSB1 bacterium]
MKKILLNLLLFGFFFYAFTNCKKDEDNDPDIDPRDKYVGTWLCTEDTPKKNTKIAYTVTINLDPGNSSQILLYNFNLFGPSENVHGLVTNNVVTVPVQTVSNTTVDGKGNLIDNNTMNWLYYVNDGADIDTISAIYQKQ